MVATAKVLPLTLTILGGLPFDTVTAGEVPVKACLVATKFAEAVAHGLVTIENDVPLAAAIISTGAPQNVIVQPVSLTEKGRYWPVATMTLPPLV